MKRSVTMTPIPQHSQRLSNALATTLDTIAKPIKYVFDKIVTICKFVKSFFSSLMKQTTDDKKKLEEFKIKKAENHRKIIQFLSDITCSVPEPQKTLMSNTNSKTISTLITTTSHSCATLEYIQTHIKLKLNGEGDYAKKLNEFTNAIKNAQTLLNKICNANSEAYSSAALDAVEARTNSLRKSERDLIDNDLFMAEMMNLINKNATTSG